MTKILYTVAKDKNGLLVKAVDADKGLDFFCPVCGNDLLLRKSGNTAKNSKRPHFAHKTLTPNCTPETALHFSFKTLLAKKINGHLENSQPIDISWKCDNCNEKHSGNLLKKIKAVKIEHNLKICQPDIALLDQNENVFAVIEIVVTHKPEAEVLEYYKINNIILIQINLKSDDDIFNLDSKASNPDSISVCINPKCPTCNNYKQKSFLTIIDGPCWKCGNTMKIATIQHGKIGKYLSPIEFTQDEINIANSKGALLKEHYSKTVQNKYIANTCSSCNSFAGEFFLFQDYYSPAGYGELPSTVHDIGYVCEACNKN